MAREEKTDHDVLTHLFVETGQDFFQPGLAADSAEQRRKSGAA